MIANQVYVFLWSILTGAILALVFDFFRLLRRNKRTKTLLVIIEDFFYLLIVTIVIIISAFITNSGELRGYMLIGYVLGALLYLLLLSSLVLKTFGFVFDKIGHGIKNLIGFLMKYLKKLKFLNKKNEVKQEF